MESGELLLVLLQRATHVTLQVLGTELADLGLTASEVNVLANLADGRARTVSEIGVAAGVRPTTLTGVLDRLADKELLTRAARTGDRRAVEISLTAAGARSAARVAQAFKAVEVRALDGVPESAVKQARRVLKALAES
ncbi:DNA-binding MarR family transcriptional regulator [Kribbella sp. VKM Ac-2571]|uniref:MarR family winged helix-turn-helix transcriptional regulator n=1 Tax=Kribbella sp. VKM Ac-2571 TaxID=2512222 RepID=UPI0010F1E0EF|nr:MarR family transcriptional regulator [Kribbella sp. VKM Ac-2571]TDO46591.1 DNA-binding MarR family transcriptional regulator [Kribbella sp. VKM Ac-2571]